MSVEILTGDCLEVLRALPDASVDSCVTDPPYGLEFMGKEWDAPWKGDRRQTFDGSMKDERKSPYARSKVRYGQGDSYRADKANSKLLQEWHEKWAGEVLRVLKPGAHLLAFSGTRTYHRMACAIEDAGFEIRDQIGWAYGSGFPKSHNLDGDWEGWGTALKPAWEPICVARKPLGEKTVAANVLKHGTGAIHVDACRVGLEGGTQKKNPEKRPTENAYGNGLNGGVVGAIDAGRWPANIVLSWPEDEYTLRHDVTQEQKRELYRWLSENA